VASTFPSNMRSFYIEPNQSVAVELNGYLIPSRFRAVFIFNDGLNEWKTVFNVAVSENGTPKLIGVEIEGNRPIDDLEAEPESVTRLQLKHIEQNRFVMLENSLVYAIVFYRSTPWINSDTTPFRSQVKLDPKTLKALSMGIDLRIRKRITPEFLKGIAKTYTDAVINGDNPIQAIMEKERVAHRTASEYATMCRKHKLKLLPKTDKGKVTINKPKRKGK